jgi:hypothetical protein
MHVVASSFRERRRPLWLRLLVTLALLSTVGHTAPPALSFEAHHSALGAPTSTVSDASGAVTADTSRPERTAVGRTDAGPTSSQDLSPTSVPRADFAAAPDDAGVRAPRPGAQAFSAQTSGAASAPRAPPA